MMYLLIFDSVLQLRFMFLQRHAVVLADRNTVSRFVELRHR